MINISLYRYDEADGSVIITPNRISDEDSVYAYRLIADDGCVLTDGVSKTYCVDTHTPEAWQEVETNEDCEV